MSKKDRDRERYLRDQENRKAKQIMYYQANRERILAQKRNTGNMKYGSLRHR